MKSYSGVAFNSHIRPRLLFVSWSHNSLYDILTCSASEPAQEMYFVRMGCVALLKASCPAKEKAPIVPNSISAEPNQAPPKGRSAAVAPAPISPAKVLKSKRSALVRSWTGEIEWNCWMTWWTLSWCLFRTICDHHWLDPDDCQQLNVSTLLSVPVYSWCFVMLESCLMVVTWCDCVQILSWRRDGGYFGDDAVFGSLLQDQHNQSDNSMCDSSKSRPYLCTAQVTSKTYDSCVHPVSCPSTWSCYDSMQTASYCELYSIKSSDIQMLLTLYKEDVFVLEALAELRRGFAMAEECYDDQAAVEVRYNHDPSPDILT